MKSLQATYHIFFLKHKLQFLSGEKKNHESRKASLGSLHWCFPTKHKNMRWLVIVSFTIDKFVIASMFSINCWKVPTIWFIGNMKLWASSIWHHSAPSGNWKGSTRSNSQPHPRPVQCELTEDCSLCILRGELSNA